MHHSALAFFTLINVTTGCGNSYWKTTLLRVFQMLHKSATNLSNGTRSIITRNLDNQLCTLSDETGDIVTGAQLWSFASCHTACAVGQWRNKCSISSMSALQRGQIRSICRPYFNRTPLVGSEVWHNCQRNTLSLGIISRCQILLYSQAGVFGISRPWAAQVVVFVEKSPFSESPQHRVRDGIRENRCR